MKTKEIRQIIHDLSRPFRITNGNDFRGAKRPVLLPDDRVDEVLWSAYHRYDKSALTTEPLQRYLPPGRKHLPPRRNLTHG